MSTINSTGLNVFPFTVFFNDSRITPKTIVKLESSFNFFRFLNEIFFSTVVKDLIGLSIALSRPIQKIFTPCQLFFNLGNKISESHKVNLT